MATKKSTAAIDEPFDAGLDSTVIEVQSSDTLAISKAEIDLQISTAKSYPRSLATFQKSTTAMVTYSREAAEKMYYKLPRKNKDGTMKMIEGPSVRLAEIIGQNWRNCRIGARVLGNDDKTVTSQGVFHDLETNVAISFEIKRRITDRNGYRYNDDMIGVTGAAAAGIAFRNAVLKGVPKMFWQPMYEKALETARGDDKDLAPRRKQAIEKFEALGVPEAAILKTLGVTGTSKISGDHLQTLRGMYNAIREGATTAEEAFSLGDAAPIQESQEVQPQKEKKNSPPAKPKKDSAPIDVKAEKPKDDPIVKMSDVYNKGTMHGWKISDINAWIKKEFGISDPLKETRQSMLPKIMKAMESGT